MRFFERIQKLDEIVKNGPAHCDYVHEIRPLLLELPSVVYLYGLIDTPNWLPILEAGKCFSEEPDDMVGFALSMPKERLALERIRILLLSRLAETAPPDVLRIIKEIHIPEESAVREYYIRTLVMLAKARTADLGALISEEETWLAGVRRIDVLLAQQYGELVCALADEHAADAQDLANVLLRPLAPSEIADAAWQEHDIGFRLEPWDYKQLLAMITDKLVETQTLDGLRWTCNLLYAVLDRLSGKALEIDTLVLLWRPSIEDTEQNSPNDILNWLIEAVRDAAETLASSLGDQALAVLEEYELLTFKRIVLHLRGLHSELDPEGTETLVRNPDILKDSILRHELFHLLKRSFGSFSGDTQNAYFGFVDALRDEQDEYPFLWPVRAYLPDNRIADYQQLEEQFGALEHPDFSTYHETVWVGPTSPYSTDEMLQMSPEELVAALNKWEYERGWHQPEPEGLARELANMVPKDPARISEEAMAFEKLEEPTCVRGIVHGLADAVKEGQSISWERVLHLCEWAVEQERGEEPEESGLEDFDPTWGLARKQIAWLLRRGTERSSAQIPFELKDPVWSILEKLVQDPNPTAAEEADRARYSDPSTIAINVVRGVALGAVFSYALWVARHDPHDPRSWDSFGLDNVRSALEDRLSEDSSPAVRSLFGKWLPYLFWLDQGWTESNVERIFPLDEDISGLWTASWDAHLMFCSTLYVEFLDLLRSSYERALDMVGIERLEKTRPASLDEHLGGHLVLFYREDVLALEDSLFPDFFERAEMKLRHNVMADAVRQVQNIPEEKREKVVERLQDLWKWRCATSIDEDAEKYHELSSFSWWFLKDDFPPKWRLEQLEKTQNHNIKLEMDGPVLEKLVDLSEVHLREVFACLEAIVKNRRNKHWGIYDDHVKEILRKGIDSREPDLRDQTENLVHYIGSLGFLSFRDLLTSHHREES